MKSRLDRRRVRVGRAKRVFKSGKAVPILRLIGAMLGVLVCVALAALAVMTVLELAFRVKTPINASALISKFGGVIGSAGLESPAPDPTGEPTEAPDSFALFDPAALQHELVFPGEMNYPWTADPCCHGGMIICSAGRLVDGKVKLQRLVEYDMSSARVVELPFAPVNDHLFFPEFNERWLVYFDAKYSVGGGNICVVDRVNSPSVSSIVKTVYMGQPELRLSGDRLAWIERTGSDRDKLFLMDLNTRETVVLQVFDNSNYAASLPSFTGGRLVWACEASPASPESVIKFVDTGSPDIGEYHPGGYVHDPAYSGEYFVWLDSPHSEGAKLYCSDGATEPVVIDQNVVDFAVSSDYICYQKDGKLNIFLFDGGRTRSVTPERESAQLLGVSGGTIMWMDVTSRDRDIIKFFTLPDFTIKQESSEPESERKDP